MNVLIIGGNRFVGKALSHRLLDEKVNVDIFNRSGAGSYNQLIKDINIIKGDRNNIEDLKKIDFSKYDAIVDMCLFLPNQIEKMKKFLPQNSKYIFVSSGAADSRYIQHYGDYGYDKRVSEAIIKTIAAGNLNYKIVRPSYIVGEGNHRPRLGYYMNKIINREHIEIAGNGQNKINVVFVQDVVDCLEELVYETKQELNNRTINIVGENVEVIDLINEVSKHCREGEVMLVQDDERAILPKNDFEFDTDRKYTTLKEGLEEYAKWYYEQGAVNHYGYNI
tara:strand:+ start:447 stop:1283 length:837 start_codon:yes stop_codon:yes gene_type:complete